MPLPVPHPPPSSPPALARALVGRDVTWNRPIFRAPPIDAQLPALDPKRVAQDLQRIGLVRR
ncbi:MAG: hypothetical protein JNL39_00620 [Opitutaceae bacterium]|nr:hypothetical protein [Opitutaceae bacterium]